MIRPIITNEAFTLRSFGGIINYFLRLIPELERLGAEPVVAAPVHRVPGLGRSVPLDPPGFAIPAGLARVNTLANTAAFAGELLRSKADRNHDCVLHRSYFYRDRLQVGLPTVITVYDLIAELFDDSSQRKLIEARAKAIEAADHIIAISETTKRDLIERFSLREEDITVTLLASGLPMRCAADPLAPRDPFVLFVGNRSGYKNFSALLDAVADSALPPRVTVRAFGGGPLTPEELQAIETRGLADRVEHVAAGADADRTLDSLYRQALAYVCPSRYEGFGLPVLEAMERGCPVIVAKAAALLEVAGSAALHFDPEDPSQLTGHILDVLDEPGRAACLSAAGLKRSRSFEWSTTAANTMTAYRAALEVSP